MVIFFSVAGIIIIIISKEMNDVLAKLFGTEAKVKILRLFLANKDDNFDLDTISKRTKVRKPTLRKELTVLTKINLLKTSGSAKKKTWVVNPNFEHLRALENLIVGHGGSDMGFIAKKLIKVKSIKLVVVTGVFMPDLSDEAEVDMLVVGDNLSKRKIESAISEIEANLGRELRFAMFDTEDFNYRMDIGDRIVRDVFEFPHEIIVDKLG